MSTATLLIHACGVVFRQGSRFLQKRLRLGDQVLRAGGIEKVIEIPLSALVQELVDVLANLKGCYLPTLIVMLAVVPPTSALNLQQPAVGSVTIDG